jgi:hypothetical protein
MVEMLDLLAENEVLEESWTSLSSFQAGAILNRTTGIGRNERVRVVKSKLLQEVCIILKIPNFIVTIVSYCTSIGSIHVRACCLS